MNDILDQCAFICNHAQLFSESCLYLDGSGTVIRANQMDMISSIMVKLLREMFEQKREDIDDNILVEQLCGPLRSKDNWLEILSRIAYSE